MNPDFVADPVSSARLALTLLHSLWQMALMAAAAWSLARLGKRSVETSYAIHVAALLVGLAAMPITYALVRVSADPAIPPIADAIAGPSPRDLSRPDAINNISDSPTTRPLVSDADAAAADGIGPASSPAAIANEAPINWLQFTPWITGLYILGVVVMLARLAIGTWRAQRLCSAARPIDGGPLVDKLQALARQWSMRVVPSLARAERVVVPKVLGLLRPTILFPAGALAGMSPDELEMILVHELAHVKRYDMWVNLLQRLAEAVLFFNPALWYLSRRISRLREYCCDELTCRAVAGAFDQPRVRYAWALLRVVEQGRSHMTKRRGTSCESADVAALAASGRSPSELRRRVARLFGEPLREPLRLTRASSIVLLLSVALLSIALPAWRTSSDSLAAQTSATGEKSADDPAPNPLQSVIASIAQHEKPYENIELTLKDVYEQQPQRGEKLVSIVRQGVKFRYEVVGTAANVPVEAMFGGANVPTQIDSSTSTYTEVFDGTSSRSFSEDTSITIGHPTRVQTNGVISDERPALTNLARPHMLLLEVGWPNVPLSTYLSGHEAIRNYPSHGYSSGATLVVRDLGTDEYRGLRCRRIFVEHWRNERRTHGTEFWLAEDRNLIPARILSYTYRESPDLAVAEHRVEEWKELRAGVWFPIKTHTERYDGDILRRENKEVVSWKKTYEVTSVSLVPKITPATFTEVEFPPGTKIRIEKDGKTTETTQPEQLAADAAEKAAQGNNKAQPAEAALTQPAAARPVASKPDANGNYTFPITVTGRALDAQGQPIAGADIYLAADRPGYKRLAQTKSGADGVYRFENVALPIRKADANTESNSGTFEVFGVAEGYALAWRPRKDFYPDRKQVRDSFGDPRRDHPPGYGSEDAIVLDLKFGPPRTIRGRIVDDLLQPIAGAQLAIRYCDMDWDKEEYGHSSFNGSLNSLNERAIVPPSVKTHTTGADGRFEFTGLPADYRWSIDVHPPGHPPRTIWAVTHEGPAPEREGTRIYSGDFEVVFPTPRKVKLRVVYDDTGEPAAKVGVGANVTVAGFWETTDENGMIEVPLPDGEYTLGMSPRFQSPYLKSEGKVVVSPETIKQPHTLRLRPAAVVDITVVDDATGKPVEGVDVWLGHPAPDSKQIGRMAHGYRSWEVETRISHYEKPRSDANGKMRVNFEPGKHRIGVGLEAIPRGYEPLEPEGKEVDCQHGKPAAIEFRLRRT